MGFPDMYGRMMGKRFDADFFLDSAAKDGTHACDYLLASDMEMVPIPVRVTNLTSDPVLVCAARVFALTVRAQNAFLTSFLSFFGSSDRGFMLGIVFWHVLAGHGLCQLGARLRR